MLVRLDLPDAIARRNHGQDRLVERTAEHFDLAFADQTLEPFDILGFASHEPFEKRPARVQHEGNFPVFVQQFQPRLVAEPIRRFEDIVEIADRLVIVQRQDKAEGHRGILSRRSFCVSRAFAGRQIDLRFAQESRGLLGRYGVNIETRSPLETGHAR